MTSPVPSPQPIPDLSAVATPTPQPSPTLGPAPGPIPSASPSAAPTTSAPPSAPPLSSSASTSTSTEAPSAPQSSTPQSSAPQPSTPQSSTPQSSTPQPSSDQPTTSSSAQAPEPDPARPPEADTAALYDALVTEHATIYGYGIVSAHSIPEDNALVSEAMAAHRQQREELLATLTKRSIEVPLTAPGYQLPSKVDDPTDAANLAVRMETDAATAYRAVLEQATNSEDRVFAVSALTQSAVFAARWKQILQIWPVTEAFPGGSE